ncbi:hypothetical protein F5876DRAFT_83127 [Lentinula aff. lateritia]|uniref:Uncharacterized protein n=1 Tax=Lentinula aff. lateritia TaxID=2804960 RepID=A0ACC1TIP1_9AGAR|nr:hypothetical protein F5876DRAFT_83127 [Lentinula aff. lateritia]
MDLTDPVHRDCAPSAPYQMPVSVLLCPITHSTAYMRIPARDGTSPGIGPGQLITFPLPPVPSQPHHSSTFPLFPSLPSINTIPQSVSETWHHCIPTVHHSLPLLNQYHVPQPLPPAPTTSLNDLMQDTYTPITSPNISKGSTDFKAGPTNQQSNSQPSGSSAPFMPKPKPFNGGKPNNSGKPQNSSNSGQSGGQSPAFNHLGANGKVFPSERERRMKNNLCLFCGGKHQIADCNKQKAWESKGCAAKVDETPDTTTVVVEEESEN